MKKLIFDKGNWRIHEAFIYNLGSQLHNFNALEILDLLGYKMLELMKQNCD